MPHILVDAVAVVIGVAQRQTFHVGLHAKVLFQGLSTRWLGGRCDCVYLLLGRWRHDNSDSRRDLGVGHVEDIDLIHYGRSVGLEGCDGPIYLTGQLPIDIKALLPSLCPISLFPSPQSCSAFAFLPVGSVFSFAPFRNIRAALLILDNLLANPTHGRIIDDLHAPNASGLLLLPFPLLLSELFQLRFDHALFFSFLSAFSTLHSTGLMPNQLFRIRSGIVNL
mmetsp:Transcript_25738/g.74459  ORF Transcript_25738/g.74459 Transcript_25738/m.74459 type:complete len:223 (-) Transcript_25738:507-1175(-)